MKKVVFVDDSKTMLMLANAAIKQMVEDGKIEAIQYENPLELLKDVKEEKIKFDLLVTDINMPEMDGFTLVSEIKKYASDYKLIALTTEGTQKKQEMIKKAGFSGWVMKPFKIETLKNAIEKVLEL